METEQKQTKETNVKQAKQPRLDGGFATSAAQLAEVAPILDALKATAPLVDNKGELTHAGRNFNAALDEKSKAAMRATDPYEAERERRRQWDAEDALQAKALDARLDLLRLNYPAIKNDWRHFGAPTDPEVEARINHAVQYLNTDVVRVLKRDGIKGAAKFIEDHETRLLPETREWCVAHQNAFMARIAAEREKVSAERAINDAKKLGPDRALKLLEASGLRLRVVDGELETAGPIDETGMAILKMYKDAIVERLQAREQWRRPL